MYITPIAACLIIIYYKNNVYLKNPVKVLLCFAASWSPLSKSFLHREEADIITHKCKRFKILSISRFYVVLISYVLFIGNALSLAHFFRCAGNSLSCSATNCCDDLFITGDVLSENLIYFVRKDKFKHIWRLLDLKLVRCLSEWHTLLLL